MEAGGSSETIRFFYWAYFVVRLFLEYLCCLIGKNFVVSKGVEMFFSFPEIVIGLIVLQVGD